MNFNYKIIFKKIDPIIERLSRSFPHLNNNDNSVRIYEMIDSELNYSWSLEEIKNTPDSFLTHKDKKSYFRTKAWLKEKHPELIV